MEIRFFHPPVTGLPRIYGRGVTKEEAEYVVRHAGEERAGRDGSRHALGQTSAGRYPRVIYVPDEDGDGLFVVTAYDPWHSTLAFRRRKQR